MAGRGERGVGWGGMYREGHKYGFPNKTTKRVLLRSKMSTPKSMRGGIHWTFSKELLFLLDLLQKGKCFRYFVPLFWYLSFGPKLC